MKNHYLSKGMFLLIPLLFTSLTDLIADESTWSVSMEEVCSIETEQRLPLCQNKTGSNVVLPETTEVRAIVSGDRLGSFFSSWTCTLLENKVQCTGDLENQLNRFTQTFKAPFTMAAGQYDLCIVDRLKGVGCFGGPIAMTKVSKVPPLPSLPTALGVGSFYSCAGFSNGTLKCWGGPSSEEHASFLPSYERDRRQEMERRLFSPPRFSHAIESISVGMGHACAKAGNQFQCWGLNSAGEASETLANESSVLSFFAFSGNTCLVTGTAIKCFGQNALSLNRSLATLRLNFPLSVQGNKEFIQGLSRLCIEEMDAFRCIFPGPSSLTHQPVTLDLNDLSKTLAHIGFYAPRMKQRFLARLDKFVSDIPKNSGKLTQDPTAWTRWYVLNALEPLMDSMDAKYVKTHIFPFYQRAIGYYRTIFTTPTLREFAKTPGTVRAASVILLSAIQAGKEGGVPPAYENDLNDLILSIGKLMAAGNNPGKYVTEITEKAHRLEPLWNQWSSHDTVAVFALIIRIHSDFLVGK